MKQVKIYDKENDVMNGGILLDDGNVICACCGALIPSDEIGPEDSKSHQIVNIFDEWINFSSEILN